MKKQFGLLMLLILFLSAVSCTPQGYQASEDLMIPTDIEEIVDDASLGEGSQEKDKVKLQVWVYDSFASDTNSPIYKLTDKFMQEYPEITIEIIPTQYGSTPYRDKYITAASAGAGPDVLMMDIIWTPQMASAELALPISQYAGDSTELYYPGPLDTCYYEGVLYGLPFYTNSLALFYNKTAFVNAGIPVPDASWSWNDFREAALTLSKDGMYGFGLMAGWGGTFEWFPWLWQNGGELLDEDNSKALFVNTEGMEAARVFLNLITIDGVVPEAAKSWKSWDELAVAFSTGVIAMYEVGDWGLQVVDEKQPAFEWDVTPLPANKNRATVVGGANWIINSNTAYPAESYLWIEYVTGEEVFNLLDGYKRLAARKGGTQQIVVNDPRMQVFIDSLEYARARPSIPNWTAIDYDCLQPAFIEVILEGANMEEKLFEAEKCANEVLAR